MNLRDRYARAGEGEAAVATREGGVSECAHSRTRMEQLGLGVAGSPPLSVAGSNGGERPPLRGAGRYGCDGARAREQVRKTWMPCWKGCRWARRLRSTRMKPWMGFRRIGRIHRRGRGRRWGSCRRGGSGGTGAPADGIGGGGARRVDGGGREQNDEP
eukprot:7037518-Prymnesium_polylepis.1